MILELVYAVLIGSLATILLLAIDRHERNYRIGIMLSGYHDARRGNLFWLSGQVRAFALHLKTPTQAVFGRTQEGEYLSRALLVAVRVGAPSAFQPPTRDDRCQAVESPYVCFQGGALNRSNRRSRSGDNRVAFPT
jgi:hypothetical protein